LVSQPVEKQHTASQLLELKAVLNENEEGLRCAPMGMIPQAEKVAQSEALAAGSGTPDWKR
jgi:hypothetical protein